MTEVGRSEANQVTQSVVAIQPTWCCRKVIDHRGSCGDICDALVATGI